MPENMKECINLIASITTIVGSLAIIWAAGTYIVTRKHLNFDVMTSCIERFQNILPKLATEEIEQRAKDEAVAQYIDLCNEEIFYFKHKYLPKEVVEEWLDGMFEFLPLYFQGRNFNQKCLPEIENSDILDNYPRVKRAFTADREYNLDVPLERQRLIKHIIQNIKKASYI